ncbi:GNAT family N-acetyltransferase [Phreatobacter sp.]|uniref:GNAT family N-acetyltransferase n=1 Tax=Phreatobacter sp. TaxID=1966341 RepID=UPI003F6E6398
MVPHLETERLTLSPRVLADIDDFVAMDSDPEVRRYLPPAFRDGFDAAAYRAVLPDRIALDHGQGLGHWTLRLRDLARSFVGTALLIPVEGAGPDIEIGWRMPRSSWGRGYAGEAARAVLGHARGSVALSGIIALIHEDNVRSAALAERLGLARAGRRAAYGTEFDLFRISLHA